VTLFLILWIRLVWVVKSKLKLFELLIGLGVTNNGKKSLRYNFKSSGSGKEGWNSLK